MAVTGKFGADFEDFYAAVQKSEVALRGFESNSAKVESRLNAVADAFSGRKVLQEAAIATKAIEEIGGATALTATEQTKVNKLIGDALTKYAALGKEAPADMLALYDATKKVEEPTTGLNAKVLAFGTAVGTMAAQATTALVNFAIDGIGKVATGFADLVMEGADVSDIAGNFDTLATAAGHVSSTLLGELRAGTHGTISDFDLMKTANQQLAAGLNLSDQQMRTLATGAFNLAQATGQDVKTALDSMSSAMVTGNAKSVALLTGKLDLESAERRYALSLGKTRDELTQDQTLYARQQALLEGVAAASARVGEQTDGIGEMVEQAAAKWDNFRQGLARSIAESPVLVAGFQAIMTSLERAFGGDQEELIAAITKGINAAAIGVIDFSLGLVEMARIGAEAYGALSLRQDVVIAGVTELIARTASGMATIQELAAAIPGVGAAFESTATAARAAADAWRGTADSAAAQVQADKDLVTGQGAVHSALNTATTVLTDVKAAMVQASLATTASGTAFAGQAAAAASGAAQTKAAAAETAAHAEALKKQEAALKAAAVEQKKLQDAMTELQSVGSSWRDTLARLDQGVVDMAAAYLRAGASSGTLQTALKLTDADLKAITKSIDEQDKAIDRSVKAQQDWAKAQVSTANEARALWDEYEKIRNAQTKTATDQQIAEIERWKRNMIAKHTDVEGISEDMYRAIEATAQAKLDAIRVDWQALTTGATTNLQQIADKAIATYQEAATGSHNLTGEQIDNFRRLAEEAQAAADGYATAFTGAADKVKTAMNDAADSAVASAGRIASSAPSGGAISGAGAPPPGYSFTNPAALSWGMTAAEREKRAKDAGGVVNYDDYNNPYIYIPGMNAPGKLSVPAAVLAQVQPQFRAMGGPVSAGGAYVVGERGPEVFVPRTDGRIATGAGTAVSVVVNVSGAVLGTADQLARLVGDALVGRLRQQGVRLPVGV
jgi:hypothetical protein